jgi:hypothetical protein
MMAAPARRAKSMFNGFGMAEAHALAQMACSKEMLALPAFPTMLVKTEPQFSLLLMFSYY